MSTIVLVSVPRGFKKSCIRIFGISSFLLLIHQSMAIKPLQSSLESSSLDIEPIFLKIYKYSLHASIHMGSIEVANSSLTTITPHRKTPTKKNQIWIVSRVAPCFALNAGNDLQDEELYFPRTTAESLLKKNVVVGGARDSNELCYYFYYPYL